MGSDSAMDPTQLLTLDAYQAAKEGLLQAERARGFDYNCSVQATDDERRVDAIIHRLRQRDAELVYGRAAPRTGYGGQQHARFAGDHFLSNVDLIAQTDLFKVAQQMPKGGHLHIHFNACLKPSVLLDIAKEMDRMFITSDMPLVPDDDFESFKRCELQFSILTPDKEKPGNLFSRDYTPRQTMRYRDFLDQFYNYFSGQKVDDWLYGKLVFDEDEAHGMLQTACGAWEKFNGRTRMMKGLFNYENAYRQYTRMCLQDFVKDKIQYAEIRPNFMKSNQLYRDDGAELIDNRGIMQIIIEEVEGFQKQMKKEGTYFGGLKVIYCTPRAMDRETVGAALDECLRFKLEWPDWIAGFDLVGEEGQGKPLKEFVPELLKFQDDVRKAGTEVPFLFHCGETLDYGSETDGNLVDALLLNSKRIGHGFALPKHPLVMEKMRERGVCVELCPISNEVLGLTPRVSGHGMYVLLGNGVHCTVSADNGTIFRSTLSHDFYQVLVGKQDMGIYGWKQLVLWSLEHACLTEEERGEVVREWEELWREFLGWVIRTYGSL